MFENQVVVITGSTNGIGEGIALKFSDLGAIVIINSLTTIEKGKYLEQKINQLGGVATYIQADMADPTSVQKFFSKVMDKHKKIDILINNAGMTKGEEFLSAGKDHWIQIFNNNFFNTVCSSREAAKIMLNQGYGKIINISSIRGINHCGGSEILAYSSAKAALNNFTKTLAKKLAPKIQVNAIAPGFVATPRFLNYPDEMISHLINNTGIERLLTVEEVVDGVCYIASANGLTGQIIILDGGFSLKNS